MILVLLALCRLVDLEHSKILEAPVPEIESSSSKYLNVNTLNNVVYEEDIIHLLSTDTTYYSLNTLVPKELVRDFN